MNRKNILFFSLLIFLINCEEKSKLELSQNKIIEYKVDCLFCKIPQNKETIIYAKFEHCFVIKDIKPVSPGHVLVIPYKHYDNWLVTPEHVQIGIVRAINEIKKLLDAEYHPDGYNIGINCGPLAGQTVMHLHVHVMPRYKGDNMTLKQVYSNSAKQ
ncbi:MAG: HIT family protein [Candidatus Babeliales bacterium]|nr:HIT family protein [Candidatus Babeliales bacterium]